MQNNTLLLERRQYLLVPYRRLTLVERSKTRANFFELLGWRHAIFRQVRHARVYLLLQTCHPDHEELVKVRRIDRQKLEAL